jgi:hypothetical protein
MTMGRFDNEYFFISSPHDVRFPELTPDQDTVLKPYEREALPFGQKPLIFTNGNLDQCLEMGERPVDPPPDVLFDGSDLVVRKHIANKLEDMEIPNLAIQPAIYKDHKKKWHEDYWFLTFTKRFDCWDRKLSKFDPDPMDINSTSMYSVYAYVLNEELLQKTPLRERLLFKMGGVLRSPVLAHQSIVGLFRMKGVDVISVAEKAAETGLLEEE